MGRILKLFSVYQKDVEYLTCEAAGFDEDLANKLGFDYFEDTKERYPDQFFLEKPSKKQIPVFLKALKTRGVTAKIIKYNVDRSESLGWDVWDGYRWGFKDAKSPQEMVDDFVKNDKQFTHLAPALIKCVFKKGKPQQESNGKYTFAYCSLGSKMVKRLRKYDFVIVFYEKIWDFLSKENKKRLVFHELLHAGYKGSPYIIGHDIECFHVEHKRFNVPYGKSIFDEGIFELVNEIYDDKDDEGDDDE